MRRDPDGPRGLVSLQVRAQRTGATVGRWLQVDSKAVVRLRSRRDVGKHRRQPMQLSALRLDVTRWRRVGRQRLQRHGRRDGRASVEVPEGSVRAQALESLITERRR